MEKELISIIIPIYNRDIKLLNRAIDSIKCQTYSKYEIIVVDDNDVHTKNHEEIKAYEEEIKKEIPIKFIYHNINKGANAARNTGINNSKGELLAFLDSDDVWNENYLEEMHLEINKGNNVGACYSGYWIINDKKKIKVNCNGKKGNIFYNEIILDRVSPTSCVVIKKECLEKSGMFDEKMPARQDYDMWIRIARNYSFTTIQKPLVKVYRNGNESISSSYTRRIQGTKMVYSKIFNMLTEDELKKYKKSIKWGEFKTYGEIYIENGMYKETCKCFQEAIKYKFDIRILVKLILIKLNLYTFLKNVNLTKIWRRR